MTARDVDRTVGRAIAHDRAACTMFVGVLAAYLLHFLYVLTPTALNPAFAADSAFLILALATSLGALYTLRAHHHSMRAALIGASLGVYFAATVGIALADPANVEWLMRGDWAQHFLGWYFFRTAPWAWPLGAFDSFWNPIGTSVVYTDSLPLVAIPLKLFAPLLPARFQYIGLWIGLNCVLQGVFGANSAIYKARPIKRRRRSNDELAQLDEQIISVLTDDRPQSVRHTFYMMTDPRLPEPVEKSENGYDLVQRRILMLRRSGRLPYGWITDATRRGYFVDTFSGKGDFLSRVKGLYRAELWENTAYYVEIWAESRSIAGVIESDCDELAVPLYPSGGFTSATLAHQAAEHFNEVSDGRIVRIFYIGDYDQSGVLIDKAIENELRKHMEPWIDMSFERIGINLDQIEEYDLPTKPRKATDKRSPEVQFTVEAEAMPAHILRELLRKRIESLLPPYALQVAQVAEESERAGLEALALVYSREEK